MPRKRITTRKIAGAAEWASYLINNDDDATGLNDNEQALCDAWLERELEPNEYIVDCDGEAYFSWSYGWHTGADCKGGDLLDYTVRKSE